MMCATLAAQLVQAQTSANPEHISLTPRHGTEQAQVVTLLRPPVPGRASAKEAPSFYKPDNLYQYIDGGADIYLLYDFQTLLHQDFKSGGTELTVDIYDMGRPEDAFGIYAAERSPAYKFSRIGAEGYQAKGILNFFQDRYYVKLSGSGANLDALLDQFAQTLSGRIGGVRTPPAILQDFPRERRIEHSEQFVRKDPLGHAFLAPAYVAAYAWGRQEGKLVISVANDALQSKARLDQFAKHFKQSGECVAAPELGEGGIRARNSYEGRVMARTKGRYLIALLNPPKTGAEILKTVAQNLR